MTYKLITGSVLGEDAEIRGRRYAVERVLEGEPVSFADMEAYYKKPGGTLLHALFGADPFDFWIGRFYLGTWGVVSLIGIFFGVVFYFYQVFIVEGTFNLLAARLDPPPISAGLQLPGPGDPGFFWMLIVFFATVSFIGWLMRQVDISRKLEMTYEIPIAYGAVVSSWLTLQFLRPLAMGAWGNGFALGITHHLDWVSNIGYQYFNFFNNPFHAIGISLLFLSTFILSLHGSIMLMSMNRPFTREMNQDGFWRSLQGYSIGEIGIHRLGFWVAVASVLFSNLCIFLSGTLVHDWNQFWVFWNRLPIWEGIFVSGFGSAAILGVIVWRGRANKDVDPQEYEYGATGLEGSTLRNPIQVGFLQRLFDLGQVGPIHIGTSGMLALAAGGICLFIIFEHYLWLVGYNPILLLRELPNLALYPPAFETGLGFGAWHEGGAWVVATGFLHVSVIAWWFRVYSRSRASGLGMQLTWAFGAALSLYFAIYFIRPVIMGTWAQAPGHGFVAVLEWTNHISVMYGNFYYNPFHMLSIFFLLGSTLLLAMHGSTIVAASRWGAYREAEEMMTEGSGTQRAQLFWRWCMGFQATSKTIHDWSYWFAALCGITGAIGILLTGTVIYDWFTWALQSGFVAPLP